MNVRCTLKKNSDFRRLYAKGKSSANRYLVVYCRRNGRGVNRMGYTVSAKLGRARSGANTASSTALISTPVPRSV